MTAEVAIMNTNGIALAADSAVTLGNGKTYNTCDKLFALSKYHPVGIMIYGSADIMGLDWEIIIKSYRDFLGKKSFDKLSDYAGDFLNYLSKFPYFTNSQMVRYLKSMCFEVFSKILTKFIDELHAKFDNKENIKFSQIGTVFNTVIKNLKEKIEMAEDEKQIKVDSEFIDANINEINEMAKIVFENYHLSKNQIAELVNILKLNFQKCGWLNYPAGIVISGYGEREIYPTTCDFLVDGILGDSLIYSNYDIDQINDDHNASILPFSQTEMVYQFANGIEPNFSEKIQEKLETILKSLAPLINDPEEKKADAISKLLTDYMSSIIRGVYQEPIVKTVALMQISELVSMAEAMVNLTALRRHVSTDKESVGGPIDVALITKGDGFIWIKKKTSYDPHLNRELNQNYFRGGRNENI